MIAQFYDDLSEIQHLVFADWPRSIERQGDVLADVIRARFADARDLADVACGIGTQSLGLAARGFNVTASDLSPRAVERAKREAAQRGLAIAFRIDDMERLATYADESADVLIACDNALPHLLDDDALVRALRRFRDVLRPDGLCLISLRDYDAIDLSKTSFVPYGAQPWERGRVFLFQSWEFDGPRYRLSFYFVFDDGVKIETRVFRTMYYAISIARVMELICDAGFESVERIDGAFFQPLLVARR